MTDKTWKEAVKAVKKRRKRRKKSEIGRPGDVVLGSTNDGRRWSAVVGSSGRLVKKIFEEW